MILTEQEKKWILAHRKVLRDLFGKRIEELKDNVFDEGVTTDEEKKEKEIKIKFVQEFKSWLVTISILESDKDIPKKVKKDDPFI